MSSGDMALTACRSFQRLPVLGLGTTFQLEPFQWITSVPTVGPGAPTARLPTAHTSLPERAAMALSEEPP
jgi:hypothetical protein